MVPPPIAVRESVWSTATLAADRSRTTALAGTLGAGASRSSGHCSVSEIGAQTGLPQQVSRAQTEPAGQLLPGPQAPTTSQLVLPGTQKPPWGVEIQMQSPFELLHGVKGSAGGADALGVMHRWPQRRWLPVSLKLTATSGAT